MKTTDAELTEKIKSLPPDFSSWIASYKGENAQVLSGSQDTIHTVHIHRISDTELDVSCSCPAVKLCKHITAFYALVKGLTPDNAVDTIEEAVEAKETLPEPMTGRQMIAEAIEMLVDGIALVIRENNKEDK
jgi:hypothetical protein